MLGFGFDSNLENETPINVICSSVCPVQVCLDLHHYGSCLSQICLSSFSQLSDNYLVLVGQSKILRLVLFVLFVPTCWDLGTILRCYSCYNIDCFYCIRTSELYLSTSGVKGCLRRLETRLMEGRFLRFLTEKVLKIRTQQQYTVQLMNAEA